MQINYKEFFENVNNPNWTGWKDVQYIESTVRPSRNYQNDWKGHAICFLNNYLLENKVREELHLEFLTNDHENWIEGPGYNLPDFYNPSNPSETYELKQMKDQYSLDNIPDKDWHNPTIKLVYFRIDGGLYIYHPNKTLTLYKRFRAPRVVYRDGVVVNVIKR